MSDKKYDQKTQDKLYHLYKDVISKYSLENIKLKQQLNDLKETLYSNHNLLNSFIMSSEIEKDNIKKLEEKSKNLWNKNMKLMELKYNIEIESYKLNELKENIPIIINQEINDLSIKNNIARNEIKNKDNIIKKLKHDLERTRNNALFKEARIEVCVSEPTKRNLEKNLEFIDAKIILSKATEKRNNTRKAANKLKNDLNKLRKSLDGLKNKLPKENNNIEFFKNLDGYNIDVDNEEEEIEEEEKEESEEDDSTEGKSKKKKEKELSRLTDKYNELKKKYDECQKNKRARKN